MLKDTSLHSSPQLALVEQQGVVVALSQKQVISLFKKSEQSNIPFDTLKEVYQRGYAESLSEQIAYNRVNSFIAGGAAMKIDQDLVSEVVVNKPMSPKDKKALQSYTAKHRAKLAAHDTGIEPEKKSFSHYNTGQGDFKHEPSKLGLRRALGAGYYKTESVLDKPTMSAKELAKKYKEPVKAINKTIKQGEKVEGEHTSNKTAAKEIARDHIGEKPDYYKKLAKMEDKVEEGLEKACWKGYEAVGMKMKNGRKVPNCVPKEEYTGSEKVSKDSDDASSRFVGTGSLTDVYKKATPGYTSTIKKAVKEHCGCEKEKKMVEDAKGYKNPTGGLTQKGRDHYNRETGSNLKAPVTKPPSELKAGSKAAGRRKSFCARMGGVEGPMKKPNGEPTRKALALKKWNC